MTMCRCERHVSSQWDGFRVPMQMRQEVRGETCDGRPNYRRPLTRRAMDTTTYTTGFDCYVPDPLHVLDPMVSPLARTCSLSSTTYPSPDSYFFYASSGPAPPCLPPLPLPLPLANTL